MLVKQQSHKETQCPTICSQRSIATCIQAGCFCNKKNKNIEDMNIEKIWIKKTKGELLLYSFQSFLYTLFFLVFDI